MADIETYSPLASGPPSSGTPDGVFTDNEVDGNPTQGQPKRGGRQRLLRGLQRISSSPTLVQLGRPRASSSPYRLPSSLSCVSLASSSASPFSQPSATGSYFSQASTADYYSSAPTSIPGSPISESPEHDGIESVLAVRKVEHAITPSSTTIALPADLKRKKTLFNLWASMPHEIRIHVLSFLQPKELVRASRANKEFYNMCFDGQLWERFDASEFYQEIPADSLAKIISAAGPFVKDLNLRGCLQVEHYRRAEVVVDACKNLINATLEGCRNLHRTTVHSLLKSNAKLVNLNLTGLTAVGNSTCKIIAQSCPQLETLNVSWCKHMDARGIKTVVEGCPKLKDVRAREIKGFDNLEVAQAIFKTNNLVRLTLAGCEDLNDNALRMMMHGLNPEIDILTDRPIVPPRKLRHLDLSRCSRLTTHSVQALGHLLPDLEGLQLTGVTGLTDAALEPILASTPRLTHLELEDLADLTNTLLSEHLAKAPCAPNLEHLSISYCESLGDTGMLPVMRKCTRLRSVFMDNTRISDLVLAEAATMVRERAGLGAGRPSTPAIGLSLVVYDCQNVTWTGVREVLSRNAEVKRPRRATANGRVNGAPTFPTEIIALKCFYGWQMTVDEHTKRVLRGEFSAASRLERKWADYMQANEEAGIAGAHGRRRRRRAREAQQAHADEEEGGITAGVVPGRRRARTAACTVM
ncbi:F-box/LRR-repeat protein 2 [Diplogelasinospora grovesii]|uniref:F-box/LRR-repeat protein 2 n=1 Tax=Diplogelasinospora grovesii TaxID=303347 RepID=A0AAN6NF71_9PEZI|nr:F-box/LRR-repeat protein 2 [Diplogelasinospora grovesii]